MGEESPERINPSRVSLESLKLEEEKKRTKSLDSRRTQYHPIPRGAERGGKEGLQEEENQLQGLLLHQIHHLQQQPPPKKRSYYPSPSSGQALYQQHRPPPSPSPSRLPRLMGAAGQIVPVQGGHIVRSTGRKDRHSKVCTAKGLRDRRVRLSAQTAIQFYDVQDRLGYDRPSKAVDWLINNAKAAIDELAELPPWQPSAYTDIQEPSSAAEPIGNSSASFLPPSLDSDAIAESFFPVGSSSSPTISYHNFPPDLLSRSSSEAQDLRLSLQSFQDPVFHHHQQSPNLFSSSATLTVDTTSANYWNVAETTGSGGGEGYVFSVPAPPVQSVLGFGQSHFFTQGGPLQSNNLLSVRAWMDPIAVAAGHEMRQAVFLPSSLSVSDMGFGSGGGGFSGFRIPARIQDGENLNGGISDQPPSGSSASRH